MPYPGTGAASPAGRSSAPFPSAGCGCCCLQPFSCSLHAATGDLLVVATDGILEVADKRGQEFGIEHLNDVIAAGADDPLPQLATRILTVAGSFGRQLDDQTILLVRCM